VFSHRGSNYAVAHIAALERSVGQIANAARLDGQGSDFADQLPSSDPVVSYMFSIAILRSSFTSAVAALLQANGVEEVASRIVTAPGSPDDNPACRVLGPRDGLVVVRAACSHEVPARCQPRNFLGRLEPALDHRLHGFSVPEASGRWTSGRTASFTCLLDRNIATRVSVSIDAVAFLPPARTRQRVSMSVGDHVRHFLFTPDMPHAVLRLVVPPPTTRTLNVVLDLPDAVSPLEANVGPDSRRIALFVHEINVG
jgi:hypothetical protein